MSFPGWLKTRCLARRAVVCCTVTLMALAAPAPGAEVVVRNDSVEDFGEAVIVGDFIALEQAGARLTSPCDGAIVGVQILWLEGTPGHGQSLEQAIHIYDGSTFPTPGSQLEILEGPVMTPGYLNEWRYLDEAETIPLNVPVTAGQQFYVTLEFANPTDVGYGGPSVVRDVDGCQYGRNVLYAIPGGWLNFCIFLQGDLVIRAVVDCEELSGACCLTDGSCEEMTPSNCAAAGGTYMGDGTDCDQVTCPQPTQACCFEATTGCLDLTESDCLLAGGIPAGPGTNCATYVCFPIGACCLPDGSCLDDMSPEDCEAQDGVFQGDGTICSEIECPLPEGACCFVTGGCLVMTEDDCAIAAGDWKGPGTDCTDADENGTADACEQAECPGDLDGDGFRNLTDFTLFAQAYPSKLGDPHYNPQADLDSDGFVNITDFTIFASYYLVPCP